MAARLAGALLLGGASVLSSAAEFHGEARAWFERMIQASQTLNYDATFVYKAGDQMRTMRIIHRADDNGERERLVALSGSAREVLRDKAKVTCILPDSAAVVVAKSRPRQVATARLFDPAKGAEFSRHYVLSVAGGERVAGRRAAVLAITPRDAYRYGYRLSIDHDTGLLLKSALLGGQGRVLEQIIYTTLALPDEIPDALLEPEISGAGFTWYTADASNPATPPGGASHWEVAWLPDGFSRTDSVGEPVRPGRMPVEHQVYSDGLASLSVFIERMDGTAETLEGPSAMGAVNAYGRLIDRHQVTVVGEVPSRTVQRVAMAIAQR